MILHDPALVHEYRSRGQWGELTIDDLLRRNVRDCPDRLAIGDAPNRATFTSGAPLRLTYAELDVEVDRAAAGLLRAGVGKDDIVVLQMPNIVEMFLIYLACARIGAIVSPLPVQYGAHEINLVLDILDGVKAVVVAARVKREDFAGKLSAILARRPAPPALLVFGDDSGRFAAPLDPHTSAADCSAQVAAYCAGIRIDADEIYTICWTSGTVAVPKGVPRSHNNWILYARMVSEAGNIRAGERLLNPFPAVNLSGIGISLLAWLLQAGTVFLHHPFDKEVFVEQLVTERIGFTVAAPTVLNMLLADTGLEARGDLGALHSVMSGAAALSPSMIVEFKRRFGIDVINGFGSNEGTTLTSSAKDMPDPARRAEYFPRIGAPGVAPGLDYHRWIQTRLIAPDTGAEITAVGVPGELLIRSGAVFPGYYRRPDLTADAFDADGYFKTGDLFRIAADAQHQPIYYQFVGRLKSLIIRGGMNIAPEELAGLMDAHPDIVEADAVGYPDALMGERVCACVVVREGAALTLPALIEFLAAQGIAKYKLPERLQLFAQLPRNPVGKVARPELQRAVLDAIDTAGTTSA